MKCPQCPYYEIKTSYGTEIVKCGNKDCPKFKAKWLRGNETNRLKSYIDQQINITRQQLYEMLGATKILGKPKKTINIFDGATNGDAIKEILKTEKRLLR